MEEPKNFPGKWLFGITNIRWGIKELIKMYSNEPSYFSYKRFQMGVAFFIFTQGAMLTLKLYVKSVSDFVIWAGPILLIAGFTLIKSEQAKKDKSNGEN
jgi:hypothetical protein